ncbi:hypothetical protein ACWDBF_03110 [Streptomyces angustmyceticus]
MGAIGLRWVDALWVGARSIEVEPRWPRGEERSSVMVGGVAEIAELAGLLETEGTAAPFTCMCRGDVTFTVRGERGVVLGVLTHHLDGGLDWGRWGGELPLLRPRELSRWLAGRGVAAGGDEARGDPL